MNEQSPALASHIPDYAGHADPVARRLSDQQTRALLGEALTALRDRLPPDGLAERFDDLIYHCQFGDQRLIKALEDDRFAEGDRAARVDAENVAVADAAARAPAVTAADLGGYLDEIEGLVKHRTEAILALG